MSIDSYSRDVRRHADEIAKFQREKGAEASKEAEETRKANAASASASKASSSTSAQSKLREAERHRNAAASHQKKVGDLETKIAREQGRYNDAQRNLAHAQDQANRQRIRDQEAAERRHEQRMKAISGTLTHHDQLHEMTMSAIEKLQALPEEIVVLFFAANPLDEARLRLDEEVRLIDQTIRQSKHRDSVKLHSRWAVRPGDLLQAINELNPRVVHFSGHGSEQDQIVFQNDAGAAKLVSKEAIVAAMAATSDNIQLVFFNTCYSRGQAEAVVKHMPAAIGMNTSIGDDAARYFSAQLYSAIGFGLSLEQAFQQAKARLMLEGTEEEKTPELFIAEGLDAKQLILVQPPTIQ